MPLYEYSCECGEDFDARVGIKEGAMQPCPRCGRRVPRLPCSGLPFISGETVAKCFPQATKAGDIKNKHGQYRVSLWNESMAEDKRRREKETGDG